MSCWVVPSVAAEYWRVSVEHVMECIRRGAVSVREDNGFTFVDVLPDPAREVHVPREQRPPTFTRPEREPVTTAVRPSTGCDTGREGMISRNPVRLRTGHLRRAPAA